MFLGLAQPLKTKVCKRTFVVARKPGEKVFRVLDFGYEFLFTAATTSLFVMPFSLRPDMCYIFVQMAFPVFHEFNADGTIRTNGLHWEGFPRLAWEALSAACYLTPPTYEVSEFERYGVPRCRVIVTVLPHPDHADWFDLSFIY
jgi:hypothetical protein